MHNEEDCPGTPDPAFHKRIAALDMSLRWAENHCAGAGSGEVLEVAEAFHAFLVKE